MRKLPDRKELRRWVQDFRRDVIRMMRLKFVLVAMGILITVFLIMLGSINMIMQTVSQSQSMRLLVQIAESDRYDSPEGGMNEPQPPREFFGMEESPGENVALLSWGGNGGDRDNGRNPGDDRNPGMQSTDWKSTDMTWDDRRPPEWMGSDMQRPTEFVPLPQETDLVKTNLPEEPSPFVPPAEPVTEHPAPEDAPPEQLPEVTAPPETVPPAPVTTVMETTEAPSDTTVNTTPPPLPGEPDAPWNPPERKDFRPDRWNVPVTIDHFAIMADAEGNFLALRNTEDYSDEEALEILEGILAENKTQGMYGWLQFCRAEKPYGTLLVVTDKTSDQGLLNNLYRTTVIIGMIMLLVLLAVLIVLSRWITSPVCVAFDRQKQFVSDAGHELKTPIAVLTANADILQDEIGDNKWLGYMQEQIGRMGQLVGDLLRLARMDNAAQEYQFTDFDLSMAVAATTLPFESAAFEQHRSLEMDIQPGVSYHGSEQHIRQLCAIFIDNAIKYSNENGVIKVTLLKRGEHSILEFYNTGCEISQEESEKIFERFYRGDKARNNQGKNGYGLGLAIAKSIMEVHRIRIHVTCVQGKWIRFLLTL